MYSRTFYNLRKYFSKSNNTWKHFLSSRTFYLNCFICKRCNCLLFFQSQLGKPKVGKLLDAAAVPGRSRATGNGRWRLGLREVGTEWGGEAGHKENKDGCHARPLLIRAAKPTQIFLKKLKFGPTVRRPVYTTSHYPPPPAHHSASSSTTTRQSAMLLPPSSNNTPPAPPVLRSPRAPRSLRTLAYSSAPPPCLPRSAKVLVSAPSTPVPTTCLSNCLL